MIGNIKNNFEKELKIKIQNKASAKVGVETVLLKTFKFYDLSNSGKADKSQFLKSIAKVGIVLGDMDTSNALFQVYDQDNDGLIDYKQFTMDVLGLQDASISAKNLIEDKQQIQYPKNDNFTKIQDSLNQFRNLLQQRGAIGLINLNKAFMFQDQSRKGQINRSQYNKALKETRINLDYQVLDQIFDYIDKPNLNSINYFELIDTIRGPLPQQRYDVVIKIFQRFDQNQTYVAQIKDIRDMYNPEQHPLVLNRKRQAEDVLIEFMSSLDAYTSLRNITDGRLQLDDFLDYCNFISFSFQYDIDFIEYLQGVWGLQNTGRSSIQQQQQQQPQQFQQISPPRNQNIQNTPPKSINNYVNENNNNNQPISQQNLQQQQQQFAQQQQQFQHSPQSQISSQQQYPQQVQNEKNSDSGSKFSSIKTFGANKNASQYNLISGTKQGEAAQNNFDAESNYSYVSQASKSINNQFRQNPLENVSKQQIELIIQRIHKRLSSRGARGFLGLQKQFQIADNDCDEKVNLGQFRQAVKGYRIDITDSEIEIIFSVYDPNKTQFVNYQVFLQTLKGQMSELRRQAVDQVFSKIDEDRDGIITINQFSRSFQARNHPDVKNMKKHEDDITADFIETLQLFNSLNGNQIDPKINQEQFEQYFLNWSTSIADDSHFENILLNCFKIAKQNTIYNQHAGQKNFLEVNGNTKGYLQDHHKTAVYGGTVSQHAPFGTFAEQQQQQLAQQNHQQRPQTAQSEQQSVCSRATPIRRKDQLDIFSGYGQDKPQQQYNPQQQQHQFQQQQQEQQQYIQKFDQQSQQQFDQQSQQQSQYSVQQQQQYQQQYQQQQNIQQQHQYQPQQQYTAAGQNENTQFQQQDNSNQLNQLKSKLIQRGVRGMLSLLRQFKVADTQFSGCLDFKSFAKCFADLRIDARELDIKQIFDSLQQSNQTIIYEKFMEVIIGDLSIMRKALVSRAFQQIDFEHSGEVALEDIKSSFQARGHPDLAYGRISEQEILQQFLDNIEFFFNLCVPLDTQKSGKLTIFDFTEFYKLVSVCMEDDVSFEMLMTNCWGIEQFQNQMY